MTFFKSKKFLIPTIVLSTIAIVGIGTGIGIATSNNSKYINLKRFLRNINENSIVIKNLSNNNQNNSRIRTRRNGDQEPSKFIKREEIFAFNVLQEQVELVESISIPDGVNLSLNIGNNLNSASNLNQGELNVLVTIEQENNGIETKKVSLKGFKLAQTDQFEKILNNNEMNLGIDFVLNKNANTTTNQQSNPTYFSIDDLNKKVYIVKKDNRYIITKPWFSDENKESNKPNETEEVSLLTYWLKQLSTHAINHESEVKEIVVKGEVKLKQIKKENERIYFYLTSSDPSKPLYLVKKDENKNIISQTAIDYIKTTNVLATDLTIVPLDIKELETKELNEALSQDVKTTGYVVDKKDEALNRNLAITTNKGFLSDHDRVYIKPYVAGLNQTNKGINFKLLLNFGSNKYAKTYDTSINADLNELTEAGFSFDVYSKQLSNEGEVITKANAIAKNENDLGRYLNEFTYLIPIKKTASDTSVENPVKLNNGLLVTSFKDQKPNELYLQKEQKEVIRPSNWILFSSYTYGDVANNHVLFTPTISLIHFKR